MQLRREIADHWAAQPHQPASAQDVAGLEVLVGRPLPQAYKAFLMETGPKLFDILTWSMLTAEYDRGAEKLSRPFSLGWIYGPAQVAETQKSYAQDMELYDDVGPRIPPEMMIFGDALARTPGFLLFNLSEKNYGSVWAWERVDETWGTTDNDVIGFVAPDFETMLASVARQT